MQGTRRLVLAGAALAALGGAWWAMRDASPTRTVVPGTSAPAFHVTSPAPADADPLPRNPDMSGARPAASIASLRARLAASSLRGAQVDGEVAFDALGRVHADAGLRHLFDHFLSLSGEFTPDEITELLLAHVREAHGDQAALEVAEWFDRYVGLRAELAGANLPHDLGQRLALLHDARLRWLGADAAQAMFGEEEAQVAHTLARRAVMEDPALDAAAREAALRELETRRPRAARAAEREATAAVLAEEQTRQLERFGAGAAERYAERSALWGEEAARRLASLDAQRAGWDRRVADYVAARERVRADGALDEAARARALQALLAARFDTRERLRIEALEGVGALPGG